MTTDTDGYRAVREGCAVFDLERGFLVLSGAERGAYLHSLVTNRVDDLSPGEGRRAFLLTPTRGRVFADFLACETGESLWLECAGGSAGAVLELLQKYYFGQDVAFEDRSDGWRALSLQGPGGEALLAELGVGPPAAEAGAHAGAVLAGTETRIVRWSDTGEEGFHVWAPAGAADGVRAALVEAGAEPGGEAAWTALQIEAGIAAFGRELGEETIPLEAPVEDAMSFDKGCYPGQEVIARLHVRGRPARQLRGLRIEGETALPPGTTLDAPGKPAAATVTASGVSPLLGAIALAFVHRDFTDPGTRLTTADGRTAEVAELPLVRAHAGRGISP